MQQADEGAGQAHAPQFAAVANQHEAQDIDGIPIVQPNFVVSNEAAIDQD